MEIRAGVTLGRYQLLTEIGRGAAGTVFQALDPDIDRLVAIKIFSALDPSSMESQSFRDLFAQEARAAGRLMHPGIVAIYDRGEEPETQTPYIVMEYVAGQPLSKLLHASAARLEERFALQLAKEIAEALAYAHEKGVVHRDIKPSNILITEEGNPKIADFGVAHLDSSNQIVNGEILGTPAYMSPEQLMGGPLDGRTDIFSLGVMLYTMLSGFRPFQGNGASTICFKVVNQEPVSITNFHLDLSKDAEYVVARAMAKNLSERYATGTEMAQDLGDILDGRPPRSRQDSSVPVSAEVSRVNRDYRPYIAAITQPESRAMLTPSYPGAAVAVAPNPSTGVTSTPVPLEEHSVGASQVFDWHATPPLALAAVVLVVGLAAVAGIHHAERTALLAADARLGLPAVVQARMDPPSVPTPRKEEDHFVEVVHRKVKTPVKSPVVNADIDDVTVIHHSPVSPVPVSLVSASLPTPKFPASVLDAPQAAGKPATLQLALQHHFAEAQVAVWVDGQLSFSGVAHGAVKKHLFLLKGNVEGRESHEIRFPSGRHEVRVRVSSRENQYDESGSLHGTFSDSQRSVLEIRCDKQGIELKLTSGS